MGVYCYQQVRERNPRRKAVLVMDTETALRFLFDAAHGSEF